MTVEELVKKLMLLPKSQTVYLAADEEGNGFRELYDVDHSMMSVDGNPIHPDDAKEDEVEYVKNGVVLWP